MLNVYGVDKCFRENMKEAESIRAPQKEKLEGLKKKIQGIKDEYKTLLKHILFPIKYIN